MLSTASLPIPLGAFAHGSRKAPTHAKILTLSAKRFKRVDVEAARDKYFPAAVAYRRLWEVTSGRQNLYVWTPIPPEGFVALGLACTTKAEPPAGAVVRCVPAAWVIASSAKPRLLFDTVGMAGRKPGSLWRVGSLGLLALGRERDPPELVLDLSPNFESVPYDRKVTLPSSPTSPSNSDVEDAYAATKASGRSRMMATPVHAASKGIVKVVRPDEGKLAPALSCVSTLTGAKRASKTSRSPPSNT